MLGNVHQAHSDCKGLCASTRLALVSELGDTLCMARQRTFLREWRKHRIKTLEAVAEHLHMSHSQLSRIERGEQPYNQELLERLAELYMCDVVDLIIRDPTAPESIWTLWDRAKPGERRQIEDVAAALLRSTGTDG